MITVRLNVHDPTVTTTIQKIFSPPILGSHMRAWMGKCEKMKYSYNCNCKSRDTS